jgi:SAM-dependent methyltransferase
MPIIGFLGTASPGPFAHLDAGFRQDLQETGFVEGCNVAIEYRWDEGLCKRLPPPVADLLRRHVTVIVTVGGETSASASIQFPHGVGRPPRSSRSQRRAMRMHGQGGGIDTGKTRLSMQTAADRLFGQAVWHQHHGKPNKAVKLYKQVLALKPDHAEACNNLGCVLLAQGKLNAAGAWFERALVLLPQLFDEFDSVRAMLVAVNPTLGEGMKRAAGAWPQRLPARDLLGSSGFDAICADALLRRVLESTTVRDVDLERLLTSIRLELLRTAQDVAGGDGVEDNVLVFCCALAKQCFINEYVFATTHEEAEQAERLKQMLVEALTQDLGVPPLRPAAVATYFPLESLPNAQSLLDRAWPSPLADVVAQQVREPQEERQYRDLIPRLTIIDDDVSVLVRRQYEENPYPRWVHSASVAEPITIDEQLRLQFPTAAFRLIGKSGIDILVAGCGTGRHPIEVARQYRDARVLAVDLSLTSLCYARRKTPAPLANKIEYAQADLLKLESINRMFDLVEASGVLHHLADVKAGWRVLLALLRPGGFMHVGLYSELARRGIVAARAFIREQGYRPTADDIRRCRQDLLNSPLKDVAKAGDFFSTSECRDLLFHIQERRLTIPEIKSFIVENDLKFIGFEFAPRMMQYYRDIFGGDRFMRDLDRWHAFETERPDTFAGMYQFWIQKN